MTEDQIKALCQNAGIQFVNRSYGLVSTKTVTLGAIVSVVSNAIKQYEEEKQGLAGGVVCKCHEPDAFCPMHGKHRQS